MIRRTLLTLALVAAPALAVAQQPMQAPATQAPAQDTTKAKPAAKPARTSKKPAAHRAAKKPATAPRDTTKKP